MYHSQSNYLGLASSWTTVALLATPAFAKRAMLNFRTWIGYACVITLPNHLVQSLLDHHYDYHCKQLMQFKDIYSKVYDHPHVATYPTTSSMGRVASAEHDPRMVLVTDHL